MNNQERRDYLLSQAEEEYKLIENYWAKANWNMVIRKSQEVVELMLKGFLKYINIEFPKEHDVGGYFTQILKEKKIALDQKSLEQIKMISQELAKKRAPAYYGEEFYTQEEAEKARDYAKFVRGLILELIERLERSVI